MARLPRLRTVLANTALVVLSVLVALGIMEITLRWRPTLLGQEFANGVRSRYTTNEGGIYYRDRNLRMNFMIPNHKATLEYNGYTWTHETDALGFRNRGLAPPADVVLLGDSFIYGHGVDYEGTVGYFLGQRTGWRVANLARQADCAFQQAYLLHAYIGVFKPRHVVYFYFENDIVDLDSYRTAKQMREFVDTPVAEISYPERVDTALALKKREEKFRNRRIEWILQRRTYVGRAWRWLTASPPGPRAPGPAVAQGPAAAAGAAPAGAATAAGSAVAAGPAVVEDGTSLGWQYTRKAIAFMKYVAQREGATLLVVPITYRSPHHAELVRAIARDLELPFLDARPLVPDPANWLPRDGHFSPTGARRMAEMVAAQLRSTSTAAAVPAAR
jgi:hypothetical protein